MRKHRRKSVFMSILFFIVHGVDFKIKKSDGDAQRVEEVGLEYN